jgi:hypothetical protein
MLGTRCVKPTSLSKAGEKQTSLDLPSTGQSHRPPQLFSTVLTQQPEEGGKEHASTREDDEDDAELKVMLRNAVQRTKAEFRSMMAPNLKPKVWAKMAGT